LDIINTITLFRGTINQKEIEILMDTGGVLSDTARQSYLGLIREGYSVNEAWELAMAESDKIHNIALEAWGGINQYAMAHAEFGLEIKEIVDGRSLISFSSNFEVAKGFGSSSEVGFVIEITLPKNLALKQPLLTSKEFEYLIINGVRP